MKSCNPCESTHTHTHTHTHTDNLANKRKDKGITLIALVITTIILLILSGIVIIELTRRPNYINAFWNIVNWNVINKRYSNKI